MRNPMDSFIEQVGKLQTGKKETTTVVVGYNESDDTIDCVEVPRDTESVGRIAHVLNTLGTVTGRMNYNNAADHLPDEIGYSHLHQHQIDAMKLIAGLKEPTMILGDTVRHNPIVIDSYPRPVKDFAIVKRRQNIVDELVLSYEGFELMTFKSMCLGLWHEPTHTKIVDGTVYHYYMLEPTMLSVQIALLCGFELKQRIERITHVNGKRKD